MATLKALVRAQNELAAMTKAWKAGGPGAPTTKHLLAASNAVNQLQAAWKSQGKPPAPKAVKPLPTQPGLRPGRGFPGGPPLPPAVPAPKKPGRGLRGIPPVVAKLRGYGKPPPQYRREQTPRPGPKPKPPKGMFYR